MRHARHSAALVAAAVIAASATGCSASSGSGTSAGRGSTSTAATRGGIQTVTVHATDQLRFTPTDLVVHLGTVRITLIDDGSYPHNLSVPSEDRTSKTVTGDPGGQQTTIKLRFNQPGSYHFECTFHASAGMTGTITVRK